VPDNIDLQPMDLHIQTIKWCVPRIPSGFSRWSFNFNLTRSACPRIPSGFSRWSFNFNLRSKG
ncbi:MAG: hypothetical protein AABN34_23015, partial [Acidobacteriota bacterium]